MTPRSLTSFLDRPLAAFAAEVQAGEHGLALDEIDAVAAEHALRVEASGTRADLLEAAEALHDLAAWAAELDADPAASRSAVRWELLGEHLTDRAARSDLIGVEALLRGHGGKPRRVLELLAAAPDGSLPRSDLGEALQASESHVSHVLRSLWDAGLVHRHRAGRQVTVTLAARGREVVARRDRRESGDHAAVAPLPPEVARLVDGLPPERRHRVADRPTLAPVIDFPGRHSA